MPFLGGRDRAKMGIEVAKQSKQEERAFGKKGSTALLYCLDSGSYLASMNSRVYAASSKCIRLTSIRI